MNMGEITIPDALAQQLLTFAGHMGMTVDALLASWLEQAAQSHKTPPSIDIPATPPDLNIHLLSMIVNNVMDMVSLHRPDGTFLYTSPSCYTLFGYTPEELIGKSPYVSFHPDDLERITASHQSSQQGSTVPCVIYRLRRKDGTYVWVETRTTPILNAANEVTHLITVTRDISERMRIEEELREERDLLQSIMQTSPSGIVVVDQSGDIVFSNPQSDRIHGTNEAEMTNRTYDSPQWKHTDYDGGPWPDERQPFVQVMKTKAPVWEVRHAIEWNDGHKVYLSINGAPILDEDGEVSKVVFTVEDYTERKRQQDELEAALERERRLNDMKSAFLSMVSHEFRTPMAIIMTSTGILRLKRDRLTESEIVQRLRRIEEQVERLNDLITDVTFINKDDIMGLSVEPSIINLQQFFSRLADELQMAFPLHQPIQIIEEFTCNTVVMDAELMQQIFNNLLSNAIKYSPNNSVVTCNYACDENNLIVMVADQGIGIPESDQRSIFEIFHRASNVGQVSGTGLGLAIVKRAVDAMQGSISFESKAGSGSRFVVKLPNMLKRSGSVPPGRFTKTI